MKKRFILMGIIGLLIITGILYFCYEGDNLQEFYYRQDGEVGRSITIDKKNHELILNNWVEGETYQAKYSYRIEGNKLIEENINNNNFETVVFTIEDNKLIGNKLTDKGYQDITYTAGTKEDFNKLIKQIKKDNP